jgi:hypothetical protein
MAIFTRSTSTTKVRSSSSSSDLQRAENTQRSSSSSTNDRVWFRRTVNLVATVFTLFFMVELLRVASERDLFSKYVLWVADNTPIEDPTLIALGTMYGIIIIVALLAIWTNTRNAHETK